MSTEKNEAANVAKPSMIENLKSNPKVLYVAVGAVVIVGLLLALSGGGGGQQVKTIAAVAPGQTVTVSNPNGGETQLNALPTLVSAAQTEEDEKQIVCRVAQGTQATVVDEQSAGGLSFVRIQIKDGPCEGNAGWTAKINIK